MCSGAEKPGARRCFEIASILMRAETDPERWRCNQRHRTSHQWYTKMNRGAHITILVYDEHRVEIRGAMK